MEIKEAVLRRTPPGDRWIEVAEDVSKSVYPSLTAGLERMFQKTQCKQYYIDAGEGVIYMIRQEKDPEVKAPSFSIYGDR